MHPASGTLGKALPVAGRDAGTTPEEVVFQLQRSAAQLPDFCRMITARSANNGERK